MRRTTHRQFLVWVEWLGQQYNRPDRADHYAMQIAAEIRVFRGMFVRNARKVQLKDLLIAFKEAAKPLSQEDRARHSKAAWFGVLAAKSKGKWQPPPIS